MHKLGVSIYPDKSNIEKIKMLSLARKFGFEGFTNLCL